MRSRPAGKEEAGLRLHGDSSIAESLVFASDAFKKLFEEVYRSFQEEMQEGT